MADGSGTGFGPTDGTFDDKRKLKEGIDWLRSTQSGRITIACFVLFVCFAGFCIFVALANQSIMNEAHERLWFLACTPVLWFAASLYLLDSRDNMSNGPGMRVPVFSLLLLIVLVVVCLYDWSTDHRLFGRWSGDAVSTLQLASVTAFFSFFLLVFLPSIPNALILAHHERGHAPLESEEDESSTSDDAVGAMLGTAIVLGAGILAFFAGRSDNLTVPNTFGLVLCVLIVAAFAVIIFLERIVDAPPVRFAEKFLGFLARHMYWLPQFYRAIDWGLVRIGAAVVGMGQRSALKRYFILVSNLTLLSLMGWFLPAPLGVFPCAIAFVLALSVSRLWAWVEDDRALAAITSYKVDAPYKAKFREDYRDETLLGFIFFIALIPITMMQIQQGGLLGPDAFTNTDEAGFIDWLAFFGAELAKAVPIVDWAEIYGVGEDPGTIAFSGAGGKHAVFLARVFVDLVLIAALLQAIAIASRNRQQKQLFALRLINRLDPFVERAELSRSIRICKNDLEIKEEDKPEEHPLDYFDLGKMDNGSCVDFRKYDENRVSEIHANARDHRERTFLEAIAETNQFQLGKAVDIAKDIAERTNGREEVALIKAFHKAIDDHDSRHHVIDAGDLYLIASPLRTTNGLRSLKAEIFTKMVEIGPSCDAIDLLTGLAVGEDADGFRYARNDASLAIIKAISSCNQVAVLKDTLNIFKRIELGKSLAGDMHKHPSNNRVQAVIDALRARLEEIEQELLQSSEDHGS
ncbi:MAG: hypothetical protein CME88_12815 [Hirschia sp.]|nr:hypothetical protein [Hirschia sp.]MBF19250.1 hypothetical protein [Hirschia sp.]